MRTGRKQRVGASRIGAAVAEALEGRQLLATSYGSSDLNVPWDMANEWYSSDIAIGDAPAGAVASSANISWKIDGYSMSSVRYCLSGPGGYTSSTYSGLSNTGGDYTSGYPESNVGSRTITLPAGTGVNGTWSFGVMDTDSWLGMGRIDSWSITITYSAPSPEIGVSGNGYSIVDGDTTPSTTDGTNFGTATQGGTTISKTFVVSNTGTGVLTLGTVNVPSGYTITQNLPSSIAAGGSANLIVTLGTATVGTFAGDISFSNNDANENPYNFRISGMVLAPEIQVTGSGNTIVDGDSTPSTSDGTDFGNPLQGSATISKTFVVRNTGSGALTVGTVSVPAGYTITQALPASIAAGGSANLIVSLATATPGTYSGDISIGNNDSDENPFDFRITGTVQVNGAPTDITLSASTIAENRPAISTIGTFTTTDPNPGGSFTYTLVSGAGSADNNSFQIVGNELRSVASFDYEVKSSYSIRVRATDQGGLSTEKVFAISVSDVGEISVREVGQWGGPVYTVSAYGSIGYMGQGPSLVVMDLIAPEQPRELGRVLLPDTVRGVSVAGDYAYVADDYSGLQVLDISNPAAPVRVGGYDTSGYAMGVSVVGSYAYVTDYGSGLQVLDISNPAAPVRVGGYDTSGYAMGVSVVGSYAYVTDYGSGLQVLDISNPAAPVRVGGYDTSGNARGVSVVGNYAYVADNDSGLQVLDISNPAAPVRVGSYDTSGYAWGVSMVGNYAYVADQSSGLQVLDISNPAAPVRVGGYDTGERAYGVSVVGNCAYVADYFSGLHVLDISNPAAPVRVGGYGASVTTWGVSVVGNYAYVTDASSGLQVLDISNPAAPVRVGSYDTSGYARGVSVAGSYAYVADNDSGLQVLDISNPAAPVRVGGYNTRGWAIGVSVVGSYAYVADYDSGLQVINISSPAAPVWVGGYDTSGQAYGVSVVGSYAYVADYYSGLQVIDISNPAAPVRVGGYNASGYAVGVSVAGSYAYVADQSSGLHVLDISNPAAPVRVGGYDTGGSTMGVSVVGSYAYMTNFNNGLHVLDISNPAAPVRVGGYDMSGYAYGVSVVGNYAYVANDSSGLVILEIGSVPPAVTSTAINDGAAQRSMVRQLGVTFSEAVTLAEGAVGVKTKAGVGVAATVEVANPSGDGKTWVVSFSGTGVTGGSLGDGVYDLVVDGAKVQDLAGNVMSGNYTQRFHRLFGDSNGDGRVNLVDYRAMRVTLGKSSGNGLFNDALDYDGGGVVNVMDLAQFRRRFGGRVVY